MSKTKQYTLPHVCHMVNTERDIAPLAAGASLLIGYAAARAVTNAMKIDNLNPTQRISKVTYVERTL